ncbi:Tat pathway signal protein [Streptomyces sp. BI20]|uniref:Tat pathway signal protein n=1 Tax=Streptomyces sp. BI20 TaxID=3403460 RepID=UPI003C7966E7
MVRTPNRLLTEWMRENGHTARSLVEELNRALGREFGDPDCVSTRTVYRWTSGQTKSPQSEQWDALEALTGLPPTALGFKRRAAPAPPSARQEAKLLRRTFGSRAVGVSIALVAGTAAARPTVGHSDVDRLNTQLRDLWLDDDKNGGGPVLESRATGLAARALELQQHGSASQTVRARLYSVAASFTGIAVFAAIDSRRFKAAQGYLEQGTYLAGLSRDGQVQHEMWRHASMLAAQRGRYADELAAAEACASTRAHRTDPFYAALTHARIALAAANLHEKGRAQRAMDRAQESYRRAEAGADRPPSVAFFTRGELHGLTGITHYRLGDGATAEASAHRCLSGLREDQVRNRAYYLSQIALAQVAQGEIEQAVSTARRVTAPNASPTSRVTHLLGNFTSALQQAAPTASVTRQWTDHVRTS